MHDLVDQGSLAVVYVGNDGNVTDIFHKALKTGAKIRRNPDCTARTWQIRTGQPKYSPFSPLPGQPELSIFNINYFKAVAMDILEELQQELASEYEITKKFIAHYPEALNDWRPHEKSGTLLWLAIHVVEIFAWPYAIMNTPYLDFAVTPYAQPPLKTRQELRQKLDADYQLGAETLAALKPEELDGNWDVR